MTNAIQISTRRGDDILVIGGETVDEFLKSLEELLGPERASQLVSEFPDFFPDGTAAAVGVVTSVFPDARVGFTFRGTPNGDWVTDKWGNDWHTRKFDEAPACQCGTKNQGKLALKKGISKAGAEYSMWACANTYEAKASDGCASVFNPRGKAYPA